MFFIRQDFRLYADERGFLDVFHSSKMSLDPEPVLIVYMAEDIG